MKTSPIGAPSIAALLLVAALTAPATPAWCQDPPPGAAKEGGFIGVTYVPRFTFDGVTFDGETGYKEIDGEEIVLLPRVDERKMLRWILGYRARRAALEVSYERTQHHGNFLEFPMEATFQAVNVDGRLFFAPSSRVQPHVLFGGVYPMLNIKDGSFLDSQVADASFKGYGFNAEAGVTVYPHRQVGVSFGYSYRSIWFDRVTGVSEKLFELRPRFRETSGSFLMTASFVL